MPLVFLESSGSFLSNHLLTSKEFLLKGSEIGDRLEDSSRGRTNMLSVHKTISVCQLALIVLATIQGCGEGESPERKDRGSFMHPRSIYFPPSKKLPNLLPTASLCASLS